MPALLWGGSSRQVRRTPYRTREVVIRPFLGATKQRAARLLVGGGRRLVAWGTVIGFPLSFGASPSGRRGLDQVVIEAGFQYRPGGDVVSCRGPVSVAGEVERFRVGVVGKGRKQVEQ